MIPSLLRRHVGATHDDAVTQPRQSASRCVRGSPGSERCAACLMACPGHALWFDAGGRWRVDERRCDGCGACASACPSQAIDLPSAALPALDRGGRDAERRLLRCRTHHDDGAAPCLAGVHPEALATLLLRDPQRVLQLDLTACDACATGVLRSQIEAQVAQAVGFARATGVEPRVEVHAEVRAETPQGVVDADAPLSRRALLGSLRQSAGTLVAAALAAPVEEPARRLPHRPALLAAVRRLLPDDSQPPPTAAVAGAFFVTWSVGESCDGCRSLGGPRCVPACPNRAWRVERSAHEATLRHDPASCSGCGACQRACPQGALTPRPAAVSGATDPQTARRIPVVRCRGCGRGVSVDADGQCRHCAARRRIAASVVTLAPRPTR